MAKERPIIVALDFPDVPDSLRFIKRLNRDECRVKVGFELFVSAGPDFVRQIVELGFDVFLDLKFHDIPNTVAAACKAASKLGVWMLNIHASGGRSMMEAAKDAISALNEPPKLIAVTVLTSMDDADLKTIGIQRSPHAQALELALLTQSAGLDGVVCSAQEATLLRQKLASDLLLVTPGIRLAKTQAHDQKRVMDPLQAIRAGADYLVIGRSITQAKDPLAVVRSINAQINNIS